MQEEDSGTANRNNWACSLVVKCLPCTEESRVRFPTGPFTDEKKENHIHKSHSLKTRKQEMLLKKLQNYEFRDDASRKELENNIQ